MVFDLLFLNRECIKLSQTSNLFTLATTELFQNIVFMEHDSILAAMLQFLLMSFSCIPRILCTCAFANLLYASARLLYKYFTSTSTADALHITVSTGTITSIIGVMKQA